MERGLMPFGAKQRGEKFAGFSPLHRADWPTANGCQEVNDETCKDNLDHFCYTALAAVQLFVLCDRLARHLLFRVLRGSRGRPRRSTLYPILFEALKCHHPHRYLVFDSLPAALVNGMALVHLGWGAQIGSIYGMARDGGGAGKSVPGVQASLGAMVGDGVGSISLA